MFLEQAKTKIKTLAYKQIFLQKTKNKGNVGLYLETCIGLKINTKTKDFIDGELKVFPLKKLVKNGKLAPKETIALCMVNKIENCMFVESTLFDKIKNILFVPYMRNGDYITFYEPIHLNHIQNKNVYQLLEDDYNKHEIKTRTIICVNLQTRTKGNGNGSKTRAWYLKTKFIKQFLI